MVSTRQFKLILTLVSLVAFGTILAACTETSFNNLAGAANATQGSNDDTIATVIPTVTPSTTVSPTVTTSLSLTKQKKEVELKGAIQAIAGSTLTVNGQTFTLTPEILAQLGTQLKLGTSIQLKAHLSSGVLTVDWIKLKDKDQAETETPGPTTTATPTTSVTPTVKDDDENGDDKAATRKGGPTNPVALTAIARNPVALTAVFREDRGKGDDKAPSPTPTVKMVVTPRPTEKSGDDNGKGDDKTRASSTKPAEKSGDNNDNNGKGNGKGKGGK